MLAVRIFISGTVQGVCFRRFVQTLANNQNIKGWCRNLDDGRVEIVTEGDKTVIDKFIEQIKNGPPLSSVNDVKIVREPRITGFSSFEIKK
ncbi:MAG: acylphosphatase [archaeon]|nr:acylphosphatase [archaeon]